MNSGTQTTNNFPTNISWPDTDLIVKSINTSGSGAIGNLTNDIRRLENGHIKTIFLDGQRDNNLNTYDSVNFISFTEQTLSVGNGGDIRIVIKNADGTMTTRLDTSTGLAIFTVTPEELAIPNSHSTEFTTNLNLAIGSVWVVDSPPGLASFVYVEMKAGTIAYIVNVV